MSAKTKAAVKNSDPAVAGEALAPPPFDPAKLQSFDLKHLRRVAKWVLTRHRDLGGVTEIRLITDRPAKGVWNGYFDPDHIDDLINAIEPDADGPRPKVPYGDHPRVCEANVYFTLNPVNPVLLARSAYAFTRGQATSDADIVAYAMLPVDVDPTRPSGISATDGEKAEALKVARAVEEWLVGRGVTPILGDSGNGYHLLVPTVPYADVKTAADQAHRLLKWLDQQFSTSAAKVDTTVANPARIFKLYGTLSMKGSSLPERPHRYARLALPKAPTAVDALTLLEPPEPVETPSAHTPTAPPKSKAAVAKTPNKKASAAWDFSKSVSVLRGVLDRSGLAYKVVNKDDDQGRIFAFETCPHHTDPDGHQYECSVIVRPNGSFAANCFHDADAGWKDFRPLIGWDDHAAGVMTETGLGGPIYKQTPSGLVWVKDTREGPVPTTLANFNARVLRTVIVDDGEDRTANLDVEVTLDSNPAVVTVPAGEFPTMNWVLKHFGARAIISPGDGVRDRLRHAIQVLSTDARVEVAYGHTGWRKVDGEWVYLHAGGAVGKDGPVAGVSVALGGAFARFVLPPPPAGDELREAVVSSLRLLLVAQRQVSSPVLSAAYRAVLGISDFGVYLAGQSGTGKTAFAAVIQQHWGAGLDARNLPANWSSTANANEGIAFMAKDALVVVDDFAPGNSVQDTARLHRDADRLFRNAGNGAGRTRMRADASLRAAKSPRGTMLATGEDVPKGQSVRARLLVVEMSPGDINWGRLTDRQADASAGRLAAAMSAYVMWLAGRYDEVMAAKPGRVAELREQATASFQHKRTPGIVAELFFGVETFCEFAVDVGAITPHQAEQTRERVWQGLGMAAAAQRVIQASGEPTQRFFDLLAGAVACGKAHVAALDGSAPPSAGGWGWQDRGARTEPKGVRVGWVEMPFLYLEPEASYAVAQEMVTAGGEPLAVTSRTLHKRLQNMDHLVAVDEARQRLTIRKSVEGVMREVLHLRADALGGAAPAADES